MKFKLWLWIFEFKKKRVADDKKIEFLAKELLKEIEGQGYSLCGSAGGCKGTLDIHVHIDNSMKVSNIIQHWSVDCGKYNVKGGSK